MGFKKGDPNINRKGRPSPSDSLKQMMRDGINYETIVAIVAAGCRDEDKSIQLQHIKLAFEYGFGKPTQYIEQVVENIGTSPMAEALKELIDNDSKQETN